MKLSEKVVCMVAVILAALIGMSATSVFASNEPGQVEFTVPNAQTHSVFSAAEEPALRVPSGSVVEMFTHEATGGQFELGSDNDDLRAVDFSRVHTMTGPVFVEGAKPGDVLAVELLEMDVADWGWMALLPQFGIFAGEINKTAMRTFEIDTAAGTVEFADGIVIPLKPFAGLMGVAPPSGEELDTFPPRANGGNMDNPALTKGATVYFPVFTEGALFSIGDTHAVQGFGEVSGTALEAPMRVVLRLSVVEGARPIQEPQYETDEYYATTGFAPTLEEASKKATRYMMDYLMAEKGLSEEDAYLLCSLAGDLHIAEMVDLPNMLVTMHMSKNIFVAEQAALSEIADFASEEFLLEMVQRERFSGVALVMRDEETIHAKAYGPASKTIVNRLSTPFHVASITKQFTAAAIMQLVEADKVALDASINNYLPDAYHSPNWHVVTVRNLLNHTGGVPDYAVTRPYYDVVDGWAFGETVDGMVKESMSKELEFVPGSDYEYSNIGYTLLGFIIEEQTGSSFADYVQDNILEPMRMYDSRIHTVGYVPVDGEASGLLWNEELGEHTKDDIVALPVTSADGGLVTTLDDFVKWAGIYSEEANPVLSKASLELITTPSIPAGSYDWPEDHPRGGFPSYGFGVTLADELLMHSGWIVGFRSHFILDRKTGLLVVIFTNNTTNDPLTIANGLFGVHDTAAQ